MLEDEDEDEDEADSAHLEEGAAVPLGWTPDHVGRRLVEAMATLRRLPRPKGPARAGQPLAGAPAGMGRHSGAGRVARERAPRARAHAPVRAGATPERAGDRSHGPGAGLVARAAQPGSRAGAGGHALGAPAGLRPLPAPTLSRAGLDPADLLQTADAGARDPGIRADAARGGSLMMHLNGTAARGRVAFADETG